MEYESCFERGRRIGDHTEAPSIESHDLVVLHEKSRVSVCGTVKEDDTSKQKTMSKHKGNWNILNQNLG